MMKTTNIKKAIVARIKANIAGIDVVAQEVKEGFKRPAFFVQLVPYAAKRDNEYILVRNFYINIHYFPQSYTNIDCLEMGDTLTELFEKPLEAEDRTLTADDIEVEIIDEVLQVKIYYRLCDSAYTDDEQGEYMEDLNINEEVI